MWRITISSDRSATRLVIKDTTLSSGQNLADFLEQAVSLDSVDSPEWELQVFQVSQGFQVRAEYPDLVDSQVFLGIS